MSPFKLPKKPKPFKTANLAKMTAADCPRPYSKDTAKRATCAVCEMDVFLHCPDCQIQITGCLCTAVERMTPEDFASFRAQIEERKRKESGLWTPGQN